MSKKSWSKKEKRLKQQRQEKAQREFAKWRESNPTHLATNAEGLPPDPQNLQHKKDYVFTRAKDTLHELQPKLINLAIEAMALKIDPKS